MVALADYVGREQSYVKHVLLENYLEALVHKTASTYPDIVYVDGFAGPWQSANERFEDTSFGIALNALRRAKESWKQIGRNVRMSAHLVERDATAYAKLKEASQRFSDVSVSTYSGDFVGLIPNIIKLGREPINLPSRRLASVRYSPIATKFCRRS
jgi:three-Cys-motif partner protein